MQFNTNANYTITLYDMELIHPDIITNIHFPTRDNDYFFVNAFRDKYNFYEISPETPFLFKQKYEDFFNLHVQYYEDLLKLYNDNKTNILDGKTVNEVLQYYALPNYTSTASLSDKRERTLSDTENKTDFYKNAMTFYRNIMDEFVERFRFLFLGVWNIV